MTRLITMQHQNVLDNYYDDETKQQMLANRNVNITDIQAQTDRQNHAELWRAAQTDGIRMYCTLCKHRQTQTQTYISIVLYTKQQRLSSVKRLHTLATTRHHKVCFSTAAVQCNVC